MGKSLGKTLQSPSLVLVKPRKDINIAVIWLKYCWKQRNTPFNQSINQPSKDQEPEHLFYPIPKRQILDSFKLKEFADDNFNLDENGGAFSNRVENTVGKGEIARHEQFLLFPTVFSKDFLRQTCKNQGLFGKGLNHVTSIISVVL